MDRFGLGRRLCLLPLSALALAASTAAHSQIHYAHVVLAQNSTNDHVNAVKRDPYEEFIKEFRFVFSEKGGQNVAVLAEVMRKNGFSGTFEHWGPADFGKLQSDFPDDYQALRNTLRAARAGNEGAQTALCKLCGYSNWIDAFNHIVDNSVP